ncbi:MAG TPA: glutathione S-transferase C-terminal domain-containing protein, partial [Candidatus Binataceae bacterium]
EPTLFPREWRGVHLALADYIDNQLEDVLFRAVIGDESAHWHRQGLDREQMWRLVRERKYGAGFCDRMIKEEADRRMLAWSALAPFEDALSGKAFLTGRVGLADFCLYGQLYYFAFTGQLKLPASLPNLRAFFGRMDRISSAPAASTAP